MGLLFYNMHPTKKERMWERTLLSMAACLLLFSFPFSFLCSQVLLFVFALAFLNGLKPILYHFYSDDEIQSYLTYHPYVSNIWWTSIMPHNQGWAIPKVIWWAHISQSSMVCLDFQALFVSFWISGSFIPLTNPTLFANLGFVESSSFAINGPYSQISFRSGPSFVNWPGHYSGIALDQVLYWKWIMWPQHEGTHTQIAKCISSNHASKCAHVHVLCRRYSRDKDILYVA